MSAAEEPDWSHVRRVTYRIEQSLEYDYASRISDLRHRLVIAPRPEHGDQRRITRDLQVWPHASFRVEPDAFGNEVAHVALDAVDERLSFTLTSLVRRQAGVSHVVGAQQLRAPIYAAERRLLRADEPLRDAAADLLRGYPDPHERAAALIAFVHAHFTYTAGLTDCFTTAAVAFRMARGVCQDYAHVAIALARRCELVARYVSGHVIGETATHAWVEFLLPHGDEVLVASYDPTRGTPTSLAYVTVAVGCDYDDVAPTSGVFVGSCTGTLRSRQRLVLESVA